MTDDDALTAVAKAVHYFSTYCLHGRHDACRRACKTCGEPCRCSCHDASRLGEAAHLLSEELVP